MKKNTQVFIVADLSGSMQGRKEETLRKMVSEFVGILANAEAAGDQSFEVTLVPFSNEVKTVGPWVASALSSVAVENLNTRTRPFGGGTALRDAIGIALERVSCRSDVPALVSVFSDGEECSSSFYSAARLGALIEKSEKTGNLTLTFAGPSSARGYLQSVGVPVGNFRAWDGGEKEMIDVQRDTKSSVSSYVTLRSIGQTSTGRFYADTSNLAPPAIRAMTKEVKPSEIRKVTSRMAGRAIADFYGSKFHQGDHYYELIKPEYVQDDKDLVVLIKSANEYRQGSRAVRALLGLPETGKVRVHPGPHSDKYQLFVQSSSLNRKVVEGQTMLTL